MAQLWRSPDNHYLPWSRCTTCGQDWPSQKILYNKRFGWQCPPCWDGLIQHDEYQQPIFPYEGTRKVNSPVTDTLLEGIAPGSLFQTYIYNLKDRFTGVTYLVHFVPLQISINGTLSYTGGAQITLTPGVDLLQPIFNGLVWTNGFDIYVGNGAIATERYNPLSEFSISMLQGVCDFGPATPILPTNFLLYDRSFPSNVYQVIFHLASDPVSPSQIEVLPATGPAVGGIILNNSPTGAPWSYFIDNGQANHSTAPYSPQILWDNSHTFYVDNTTNQLVYFP